MKADPLAQAIAFAVSYEAMTARATVLGLLLPTEMGG